VKTQFEKNHMEERERERERERIYYFQDVKVNSSELKLDLFSE